MIMCSQLRQNILADRQILPALHLLCGSSIAAGHMQRLQALADSSHDAVAGYHKLLTGRVQSAHRQPIILSALQCLVVSSSHHGAAPVHSDVRHTHLGVGIPPDNHLWLARDVGQRGEQLAGLLHGLHTPAALPLPGRVARVSHHHLFASRCDSPLTDNTQVCNALREYGTCRCTGVCAEPRPKP